MLEGTLDTFSLPDIFQLLAFTSKTGCLNLSRDANEGRVWFREGQVHYAVASTGRLALGKRLVGAGVVTAEQLKEALQEQQGQGTRLGRILVEKGHLEDPALETFLREQIQDAVFDLMRWSEGTFRFEGEVESDEPVGLTVTVENLIMEGSRRLDEWDAVRNKIPGRRAVVAMAPAPEGQVELNLQPAEWRLLALVDGRRTVGDLIELSGQGEFSTCKLLYGLVGAGLLEVRDPEVHGPPSIAALLAQHELLRQLEASIADVDPDVVRQAAAAPPVTEPEPEAAAPETEETAVEEPAAEGPVEEPVVDETPAEEPVAEEPPAEEPAEEPAAGDLPADQPAAEGPGPVPAGRAAGPRITVDPSVDADLLDRLIEGVRGL